MPTNLETYEQDKLRTADRELGGAMRDSAWAGTFRGEQSPEAVRARLDVDELARNALELKQQMLSRVDKNAQEIYQRQAEFNEWQSQAPLRQQLLQRKVEAEGASERFRAMQDAETLRETSAFYGHLLAPDAPRFGSGPDWDRHVLSGLQRNPRFATTAEGRKMLEDLGKASDVARSLNDITAPPGTKMGSVTFGKDGTVQQATFRADDEDAEKDFEKDFGISRSQFLNPSAVREMARDKEGNLTGKRGGEVVQVDVIAKGEPKTLTLSREQYKALGGKLAAGDEPKPAPNDRIALAKKALEDPNASEAHKAAARRILGTQ